MATIERENIGTLTDKITVKIQKEDYLPSFEKKLKEYSKTANIPGFRKGMVPPGLIRKMYGSGIFSEEVLRTVEKELYSWLNTEKPDIFAQPLPMYAADLKMDLNQPSDYHFDFEIGLKPAFNLPDLSAGQFTLHKVGVTDEMVQDEINRMQVKGGNMTEPESVSHEDTVLNVTFTELDANGNPLEGGVQKENSALLKYFTPALQAELSGKKAGDSLTIQLNRAFEGDKLEMMLQDLGFDKADAAAAAKNFKLDITKLGLIEKRALDEAFFNEIYPGKDIKTLDELKEALRGEIEQYWLGQSNNQLHDQVYHFLLDQTQMEFPETFLKRWLQTGGEKPKTAEEAEQEFPGFSNQLKWTLISDRLIQDHQLDVNAEELRNHMKQEVMRYFGSMQMDDMSWLDSYVERMMKDEKQVDATYRRLVTEKLFNWAAAQTKPVEKTVTPEELAGLQHHHEH